jgi:hypothetical protein
MLYKHPPKIPHRDIIQMKQHIRDWLFVQQLEITDYLCHNLPDADFIITNFILYLEMVNTLQLWAELHIILTIKKY